MFYTSLHIANTLKMIQRLSKIIRSHINEYREFMNYEIQSLKLLKRGIINKTKGPNQRVHSFL